MLTLTPVTAVSSGNGTPPLLVYPGELPRLQLVAGFLTMIAGIAPSVIAQDNIFLFAGGLKAECRPVYDIPAAKIFIVSQPDLDAAPASWVFVIKRMDDWPSGELVLSTSDPALRPEHLQTGLRILVEAA